MNQPLSFIALEQMRDDLVDSVHHFHADLQGQRTRPERTQIFQGTFTALKDFTPISRKGLREIQKMKIAIEDDALDKIIKMDLSGLPALEALVKANIMQHFGGINHTKMLLLFERACISFEQGDTDMALGLFMALLLLNPFIAALWFCIARCFESKRDLQQSMYAYAICQLLGKGNLFSALDAAECLIAAGNIRLGKILLLEIKFDLDHSPNPSTQLKQRYQKLELALSHL
jgi:hypothetical protein